MWFLNRIANPLVRLILRSPLHGMLSKSLLLLSYRGQKTGKEYTLPVQYAHKDEWVFIVPGNHNRKTWWRNLRGGTPVWLTLGGKRMKGTAEVLEGNRDAGTIAEMLQVYFRRFPAAARYHDVRITPGETYREDELQKAAASMVIVRVRLDQSDPSSSG